jgi:predicted phage terminase large subunit-like protein
MVEDKLFELASQFGQETLISIPQDPNAQAGAYARGLQKRLAEKGFTCRLQRPVKSKLVRFQPFAAVTEGGFVNVVEGSWNKPYFDQLEIFDGSGKYHDDMVDATSDAFFLLNQNRTLPSFTLPDLSQSSNFGFQPSALPLGLTQPLRQGEFT